MMCVTMDLLLRGIWRESGYNLGGYWTVLSRCWCLSILHHSSWSSVIRDGWLNDNTQTMCLLWKHLWKMLNGYKILFILSVMKYLQHKTLFLCAKISVLSGLPGEHNETMAPIDNTTASWINWSFWSSGYIIICLCFLVKLNCNN